LLGYLTRAEVEAVLNTIDRNTWSGRRDHALFMLMYNTGTRVSEVIGLRCGDNRPGPMASVCIHGKGRKEQTVPLWKRTAAVLQQWLAEIDGAEQAPLFPNRHGRPLTRSGVEDRLQRAVSAAADRCRSLRGKQVSPHTLRHTTAMHLLQAGVDVTVIALWLGHESSETTHQYVEADLEMKRSVLNRIDAPPTPRRRRKKAAALLDFLDRL
jgi:site-specific recombinase XerD